MLMMVFGALRLLLTRNGKRFFWLPEINPAEVKNASTKN
jgi:hypothetical protein